MLLHVALDERQTWKVELEPEDTDNTDGSQRSALIDLPDLYSGTHYVCVTAYLPSFVRAAAALSPPSPEAGKDYMHV